MSHLQSVDASTDTHTHTHTQEGKEHITQGPIQPETKYLHTYTQTEHTYGEGIRMKAQKYIRGGTHAREREREREKSVACANWSSETHWSALLTVGTSIYFTDVL